MIELKVEESGFRLDKYVSLKAPDISRTRAQKLIEDGHITVNGKTAKSSQQLEIGSLLEITIPALSAPTELLAEDIPLKILFEDADLLVVDKPAGMTVHPAPGHYTGTLVNAILAHIPNLEAGGKHSSGNCAPPGQGYLRYYSGGQKPGSPYEIGSPV